MWFKIPGSDDSSKWHFHRGGEELLTLCGKIVPDKPVRKAHVLPPNFAMCKSCQGQRLKNARSGRG